MPYESLTRKHLDRLKTTIENVMRMKNLDASGEASDSLEIQGSKLVGNDYIYFLDKGRAPGRFPPVSNIREWVRTKLGISNEKEVNSVGFLVGRKMAREGTEIFKNKSKGLQLDNLVDEMLNDLQKELPDAVAAEAFKWL